MLFLLAVVLGFYQNTALAVNAAEEEDSLIVVIDPGHGGEDLGGVYEDYTEKGINLITAKAMKAELEQYEGITVYLTRTGDTSLSLKERCEFAESVGADFLFCLHYNLSEYHTLFGAETWISAFGEEYSKGYAFADIEMELLKGLGLHSRGIKTRLNDKGQDYYGIIRHSTEKNLPCVLIEHCHMDQENDTPFCDQKEKQEAFGRLDAEAVARYFGLRSESLGKDFSSYQPLSVPIPSQPVRPDQTEPDICIIEMVGKNESKGEVKVSISAADYDSGILYYDYSYDGGITYSGLQRWPDKTKDTLEFTMTVPSGVVPQIVVNAYNGFDLYTTSNTLNLPSMNYQTEKDADTEQRMNDDAGDAEMEETAMSPGDIENGEDSADSKTNVIEITSTQVITENDRKEQKKGEQPITITYFLKICLICFLLVFAMVLSMIYILRSYKRKQRGRKRK